MSSALKSLTCLLAFSILIYKILLFLGVLLFIQSNWFQIAFWLPTILIQDCLFIAALILLFSSTNWILLLSIPRYLQWILVAVFFSVALITSLSYFVIFPGAVGIFKKKLKKLGYRIEYGQAFDTAMLPAIFKSPLTFYKLLKDELWKYLGLQIFFISIGTILFFVFRYKKSPREGYKTLPLLNNDQPQKSNFKDFFKSRSTIISFIFAIWMLIALITRPLSPWGGISTNLGFDLIGTFLIPDSFEYQSIDSVFSEGDFKRRMSNLGFVRRKKDSEIKNVITIFIESSPSKIFPFDRDSFAGDLLLPEIRKIAQITPFFDKLVKEGAYAPNSTSTVSSTIKSLLSTFCSMYPYPENFDRGENEAKKYHNECLPDILSKRGFDTAHFQGGQFTWEHMDVIINKTGLQKLYGLEKISADIAKGIINSTESLVRQMSGFNGFYDEVVFNPMMEHVDASIKADKPFFLSYLTSVNHPPYEIPDGWDVMQFSKDADFNKNTVRYVDNFFEKMMKSFEEKNLLENTLFVFLGDHGFDIGEHAYRLEARSYYETANRIPILLYTENKHWKPLLKGRVLNPEWTNLDVYPTILEILNGKQKDTTTLFNDFKSPIPNFFEGQSMLQPLLPRDRWTFTNPGFINVVLTEPSNVKWIYTPRDKSIFAFNLTNDPGEFIWNGENIDNFESEKERVLKKILGKVAKIRSEWHSGEKFN